MINIDVHEYSGVDLLRIEPLTNGNLWLHSVDSGLSFTMPPEDARTLAHLILAASEPITRQQLPDGSGGAAMPGPGSPVPARAANSR
jgi:hypothetical protein